jgi:hypothetical protein
LNMLTKTCEVKQRLFNIHDNKNKSIIETILSFLSMPILFTAGYYISRVFTTHHNYLSVFSLLAYISVILSITYLIYAGIWCKNLKAIIFSAMTSGFILRFMYASFTSPKVRAHDVYTIFGHYNYIKYIADNLALPNFNTAQAYHPPFHHILGAIFFKVGAMLNYDEAIYIKAFQIFMAFLSCFAVFLIYKMFKILKCNDTIMVIAISLVSFHPALIMLSAKINNDNTVFFMLTLTFYFLIRWLSNKNYKNIIFLALSFSLAVLTKVSAAYFIILIATAFLGVLIKNRHAFMRYFKQYLIFGLIAAPLSLSYIIRNYILFKQPINYVLDIGNYIEPTLLNSIYTPILKLFGNPFNPNGITGGDYFWDFFLKSASFSEFTFKGLENLARVMNLLTLLIAIATTIIVIISFFINKKFESDFNVRYLMFLNIIIPLILMMVLRFSHPVSCSQDFRYVVQILISTGFFLGYFTNIMKKNKQYVIVGTIATIVFLYCFLSGVFILNTHSYFG